MNTDRFAGATTRAQLRRAALELFAERGFDTSTRTIAAAVGTSPALVTHHFGSKVGLRAAVDEDVLKSIGDVLDEVVDNSEQSIDQLITVLGEITAKVFGSDRHIRGYLRRSLIENSTASADLFAKLLEGAREAVHRLAAARGVPKHVDLTWAPYQILFLILGPLLLEQVVQPTIDMPMFDADVLASRSAANQALLLHGLFGTS